jgi:alkylation response protein AidB-like acyl-CoA dehydrogenase
VTSGVIEEAAALGFDPIRLRERIRTWLAENADRRTGDDDPWRDPQHDEIDALFRAEAKTVAWAKDFQRRLFEAGLAGLTTPVDAGGRGLPAEAEVIYQEEVAEYAVPRVTLGISLNMVRHVIVAHGTDEQRRRYVPAILRGDEIWCQLFSEPGAGSDLAGLRSRAVRDGDEFILNGQKVWTSGAQYADFGLLLARTNVDVPKHAGITAFALDMHAPGISVRPLRQATGASHFNEVFFDDVRVPAARILGEMDQGWRVAITTLMHERGSGSSKRADLATPVIEQARSMGADGDPVARQRLSDLWIRTRVIEQLTDRVALAARSGRDPGPQGSLLKLGGAKLAQDAALTGMGTAGPGAVAWQDAGDNRWAEAVMATRRVSIAGGTDEVQRNIIGERLLGLPREPSDDRTLPFKDLRGPATA